jgi:serine/threonine protein kinase
VRGVISPTLEEAETLVRPERLGLVAQPEAPPSRVGRYEIRGLLGAGAIGRVYRAFDPVAEREVALKRVREALSSDEKVMIRFRREADTVQRLSHPNLVAIHDVGPDYMVMELVGGESLDKRLARAGRLSPEEALPLLGQVAEALDHVHARGIVHRDVKPSNVLVLRDGSVKLTDFGIAHLSRARITTTGELIGSPAFMAPEQIALGDVEPASDVYALGVLAFQCLTAQRPFAARGVAALLKSIVYETPPLASSLEPRLPPAVDSVLERVLAKDPDERFASARDFVAALAEALGTPISRAPRAGRGFFGTLLLGA